MPPPLTRQATQYDVDWRVRRAHCQLRPPTAHEVSEDPYMSPLGLFIHCQLRPPTAHEVSEDPYMSPLGLFIPLTKINFKFSADFANFHNANVKFEYVYFEFVYDHN